MHVRNRAWIVTCGVVTALLLACYAVYRYQYPYGCRSAYLPVVLQALRSYGADHGGRFPNGERESQSALFLLYPDYLVNARFLAGLTGNRSAIERECVSTQGSSGSSSTWVYWPGFTLNDSPKLAIIWERRAGVRFNGKRGSGHAVGFLDGTVRQVPQEAWQSFVNEQTTLRRQAENSNENSEVPAAARGGG